MSIIVAVQKRGRVAIAWDTMSSFGSTRCVNQAGPPKVFRAGTSFIGSAGFTVYRNLLDHYLAAKKTPTLKNERSIFEFFIHFWRDMHARYHFVDDHADSEDPSPFADLDAEFLVVNRYGIFCVQQILSVSRYERFCAIGSGASHAEGALQVLYQSDVDAREIAESAVRVALEFDAASGGAIEALDMAEQSARQQKRSAGKSKPGASARLPSRSAPTGRAKP